jgi:predicted Zn-dependent protease
MEAEFRDVPAEQSQKMRTDLMNYCGQDTDGMIEILKKLQEGVY